MTTVAQRSEIFESIRFFAIQDAILNERAERCFVMDIMLANRLRRAAHLTFELIPFSDSESYLLPIWSVIVRVVGPHACIAQTLQRGLRQYDPIARRLQFGRRQVKRLLPEILVCEPAQLAESDHLSGDLNLAVALFTASDRDLFIQRGDLNLRLLLRLGIVIQADRHEMGDAIFEIKFLHKILLGFVHVDCAGMHHP